MADAKVRMIYLSCVRPLLFEVVSENCTSSAAYAQVRMVFAKADWCSQSLANCSLS